MGRHGATGQRCPGFPARNNHYKLTFNLRPVQMTTEDRKQMPAVAAAVAEAKDWELRA